MVYQHLYTFIEGPAGLSNASANRHVVRKFSPEDRLAADELKLGRFATVNWLEGGTPEAEQAAVDAYVAGVKADRASSTVSAFYPERHAAAARRILAAGGCIMDAQVLPDHYPEFSGALREIDQANLPTKLGGLQELAQE